MDAGERQIERHVLLAGMDAGYKMLPDGNRQIVAINVPGDILDLDGLPDAKLDRNVVSLGSCQVGVIPHGTLRALADQHPGIARALWRQTLLDAAVSREWVVNVGQQPA